MHPGGRFWGDRRGLVDVVDGAALSGGLELVVFTVAVVVVVVVVVVVIECIVLLLSLLVVVLVWLFIDVGGWILVSSR